ncbi:MAG: hypothetical protein HC858_10455 [Brachymonas sp.]|nr:hypothetical protein [Brachymonas sp.]
MEDMKMDMAGGAAVLGTMQAEVTAAYMFLWLRGWFNNAAEKERLHAETQWSTALRVLDSMSYLRAPP